MFNHYDPREEAKGLVIQFFSDARKNNAKSLEEGREVYEEKEFVKIVPIGDRTTEIIREATEKDKERFAPWYEAFKKNQEMPVSGTPLEEWPSVGVAKIKELKSANVRTVEELAAISDAHLKAIGLGGVELREKARAFLEAAKDGAAIQKYADENTKLKEEIQFLNKKIEELEAIIKEERAVKRKRKDDDE